MNKTKITVVALIFVIGSSLVGLATYRMTTSQFPWEQRRSCIGIEAACEIQLKNAERKATEAISKRALQFSNFIESRKAGAKSFSNEMVSFHGMWRTVKPKFPGTDEDGHKKYVVEKFEKHIFSPIDFSNALKRSIEGGVKDIEGIENELAIALRQEVLGQSIGSDEKRKAEIDFQNTIANLLPAAQQSASKAAGSLAGSEATTYIASQVLLRLGVTAGIATVGAANSWWTFGASLVIGIAVSSAWEWYTKPADKIEVAMIAELDRLARSGSKAIQTELTKIVKERSLLWRTAAYGVPR